ncbi:MAG TPA: hypothetical protein VMM76_15560 [Pirellulaceae bacterium]|nr:hypothetical protein [Pirellulaceae bacterium]
MNVPLMKRWSLLAHVILCVATSASSDATAEEREDRSRVLMLPMVLSENGDLIIGGNSTKVASSRKLSANECLVYVEPCPYESKEQIATAHKDADTIPIHQRWVFHTTLPSSETNENQGRKPAGVRNEDEQEANSLQFWVEGPRGAKVAVAEIEGWAFQVQVEDAPTDDARVLVNVRVDMRGGGRDVPTGVVPLAQVPPDGGCWIKCARRK